MLLPHRCISSLDLFAPTILPAGKTWRSIGFCPWPPPVALVFLCSNARNLARHVSLSLLRAEGPNCFVQLNRALRDYTGVAPWHSRCSTIDGFGPEGSDLAFLDPPSLASHLTTPHYKTCFPNSLPSHPRTPCLKRLFFPTRFFSAFNSSGLENWRSSSQSLQRNYQSRVQW